MDARHLCTVVLANDYKKLVAWYRKTFVMRPKMVVSEGFDWTELVRPGLRIGLTPARQMRTKLPKKRANAVILHLVSRDVRGLMKRVKACGGKIRFGPSFNADEKYWYGGFTDIEGNMIWVIDLEAKD